MLTDVAHNLLTDFRQRALSDNPFAAYAAKRIVRDLLTLEGNLVWVGDQLVRIDLCRAHPAAETLVKCMVKDSAGD